MAEIITVDDLPTAMQSNELIAVMVAGANAKASRVAPCLTWTGTPEAEPAPSEDQLAEAKLVLIGAIGRWIQAGSGAVQSQTAGPFGMTVDTRQKASGYNLWPSDIESLQEICSSGTTTSNGAFSIRPSGGCSAHMPWCSLAFGATYCSCGADLTNEEYPLYEGGVLTTGDEY
ncbi:MAG TPA: hypothetical protein VJL80_06485 [Aeromicrobium sp.]|nr:hypothetical protein [Aeromicrobium sp.]HKY57666.1 hypothetical protein [Aeromicrobium sp.]